MVIEKALEYNQSIYEYIAFISLQKAFDSIPVKRYGDAWKRGTVAKEG